MLRYAIEQRDWREVMGQLVRLALAPLGALTGRIPIGRAAYQHPPTFDHLSL
jgi:hypothetical protein